MKAPRNMKSLVVAIFFSTSAISAAISEALNSVSTSYPTEAIRVIHGSTACMELWYDGCVVRDWRHSLSGFRSVG
jgi:dipeptide/tripeptide permease